MRKSSLAIGTMAQHTRQHGDDGTRSALAAAEIANFGVPREKITKNIFDVNGTAKTLCLVQCPAPDCLCQLICQSACAGERDEVRPRTAACMPFQLLQLPHCAATTSLLSHGVESQVYALEVQVVRAFWDQQALKA